MQVIRTIIWVLVLVALLMLVFINWGEPVGVRFWPGVNGDNLLFEWPVGFVALVFLVIGALPPYLLYRGTKWRLQRRIAHLEAAAKAQAIAARPIDVPPADGAQRDPAAFDPPAPPMREGPDRLP